MQTQKMLFMTTGSSKRKQMHLLYDLPAELQDTIHLMALLMSLHAPPPHFLLDDRQWMRYVWGKGIVSWVTTFRVKNSLQKCSLNKYNTECNQAFILYTVLRLCPCQRPGS